MADSRICLIPECGKPAKSLGLCGKHYQSSRHLGVRMRTARGKHKTCTHPGCGQPHYAHSLCVKHHYYWEKANKPRKRPKRCADGELLTFVILAETATSKDCIIWPPLIGKNDYLQFKQGGRVFVAHRHTCEAMHGSPPSEDLFACHSCNRRNCINPNHVRWDDARANMHDKIEHGTQQIGSRNGFAKLTEEQARSAKYDRSKTTQEWARHFGVSRATISHIRSGRNWAHI